MINEKQETIPEEPNEAEVTLRDVLESCSANTDELGEIKENVKYLQDLFVRRLNEDKQKTEMIRHIEGLSTFAVIEPFISDMILILDRIDNNDDDFAKSIGEELYDALSRRGVERIEVTEQFDPSIHKAIRVVEDANVEKMSITSIVRNGYRYMGKVIRPTEVIISKPAKE